MIPSGLDPARVRAVAMDLDGTILGPSLELTDALVDAVAAVRRSGVEPIIATGRMLRSALPYARQLGITAPLICYQGALIADVPTAVAAPPAGAGRAGQGGAARAARHAASTSTSTSTTSCTSARSTSRRWPTPATAG